MSKFLLGVIVTLLALAVGGEKDAVPALIELLPDLPRSQAWQVEDVLFRVAGKEGPDVDGVSPGEGVSGKMGCIADFRVPNFRQVGSEDKMPLGTPQPLRILHGIQPRPIEFKKPL